MTSTDTSETPEEAAVRKAAEGGALSSEERADASDYFLGKKPPPGRGKTFPLDVDFGTLDEPDFRRVVFKNPRIEELDEADDRSVIKDEETGEVVGRNTFIQSAWIVARTQVEPRLGPIVEQRNREGGQFPDAASLLMDLFAEAPGVLIQAATAVRRRARIGTSDQAVREVEAGKTST